MASTEASRTRWPAVVCLLAATVAGAAQPLPQVLGGPGGGQGSPWLPDYSYAGYGFGLAALPTERGTVIDVVDHGAVPDDGRDDSAAVLRALARARETAGRVTLRFPVGRFDLSEILRIDRSDIVIEGSGSGSQATVLAFARPLSMADEIPELDELRRYLKENNKRQVEPARNIDMPFSEYSWSGGFIWIQAPGSRPAPYLAEADRGSDAATTIVRGTRGSSTIELVPGTVVAPGEIVRIEWRAVDGRDSAILESLYGTGTREIGSHHWSFPDRPLVVQSTRVLAVRGQQATIADPLLHDINARIPARLARFKGLVDVGIRDLVVEFPNGPSYGHHLEQGFNAIYFTNTFDGFVEGVRIVNADSGVLTYDSANLTIRDIVTEGDRRAHYAVHLGNVHNVLVSDLLVANPVIHSLSFNTQASRSVFQRAIVLREPVLDQHAGANHQNLFDDVRLFVDARRGGDGRPRYAVWDGSGASYWQPGHGKFNTTWNLSVFVRSGAAADEVVVLEGLDEGPEAIIVGVSGNRKFDVDYRPAPHMEMLNARVAAVQSLYDYQLGLRRSRLGKH